MSRLMILVVVACASSTAIAHHPQRECQPVKPRVDCLGPIGNRLPAEYRRRYNRPTDFGGRIAYWIAPSSQEAMAWHKATHRGNYEKKMPRTEMHFFYPKPWETLRIGARPQTAPASTATEPIDDPIADPQTPEPIPVQSQYDTSNLPASVIDLLDEV